MHGQNEFERTVHWWWFTVGIYALLATAAISLTGSEREIATIWPANAALIALVLSKRSIGLFHTLSAGFVAGILANALTRGSVAGPILFGFSNMLEVAIAAKLITAKMDRTQPLTNPAHLGWFLLGVGIIPAAISGLLGATTFMITLNKSFFHSFVGWFWSDALGLLIFTPVFLSALNGDFVACFRQKTTKQRIEAAFLHAVVLVVAIYVFFFARMPLLFLIFPPVMLMTFRVGRLGTEAAIMVVAIISAIGTVKGLGPISGYSNSGTEQSLILQAFIATLSMTCLPMVANLKRQQSEASQLSQNARLLAERAEEMRHLATKDSLTGLLNRRGFEELTERLLAGERSAPLCLLAIDLDRFKQINDSLGHGTGDAALAHMGDTLRSIFGSEAIIGRVGGDEFLVLLDGVDQTTVRSEIKRLKRRLRSISLQTSSKEPLFMSASVGLAQFRLGMSMNDLKSEADVDLYRAKSEERGKMEPLPNTAARLA